MSGSAIIGGLVALACIALFFICAIARKDSSCGPERDCSNCARYDKDKVVPPECAECVKEYPLVPNWKPIDLNESQERRRI